MTILYERLSTVKTTNPYFQKDLAKSRLATKFIGRGSTASSTNRYMLAAGDLANTGLYTITDKVFVSVEGARRDRLSLNIDEINLAIVAGVTFIADAAKDRLRQYNVGERELAKYLIFSGYAESSPGVWTSGS